MANDYGIDVPRVTNDEATELCVYHLQMASAYFQAAPDDMNKSLIEEIKRKMQNDSYAISPAMHWAEHIWSIYEAGKDE